MADLVLYIVQFFVLILVIIGTIFTQKGFSNMNKWLENILQQIKKIESSPRKEDDEGEIICKKCGKKLNDHKFGDLKKCGLLGKG